MTPSILWTNWQTPGQGVFPLMVGAVWVILAVWQLIQSLRRTQPSASEQENKRDVQSQRESSRKREEETKVLFMIAVFMIYLVMVKWVGFFTSNFLFVIISSRLMGAKGWKRPITLSAGISLFCYLLFEVWLKLSFPRGILF